GCVRQVDGIVEPGRARDEREQIDRGGGRRRGLEAVLVDGGDGRRVVAGRQGEREVHGGRGDLVGERRIAGVGLDLDAIARGGRDRTPGDIDGGGVVERERGECGRRPARRRK